MIALELIMIDAKREPPMTNPAPTENEEIALLRGWTRVTAFLGMTWKGPEGDYSVEPPDFEHDWAYAGPLLEELVRAEWTFGHTKPWEGFYLFSSYSQDCLNESAPEAISRAWRAWKEEGAG